MLPPYSLNGPLFALQRFQRALVVDSVNLELPPIKVCPLSVEVTS